MLPIGQTRQGAYYAFFALSFGRAQKRVAQQRIDSKIDLGRIVDIRKKVFSDVKVCPFFFSCPISFRLTATNRKLPILAPKLAMNVLYHRYDLHPTMIYWRQAVGLVL